MILRPTIEQNQLFAGVIGLLSGLGAALAYMQVAALGRMGEPESRTVFYFSIGTTVVGGIVILFTGHSAWTWPHALWLLPIGVLAALGQLSMTKAYSRGSTLVVANLQYSGIVFAALYGLFLFGDQIPLMGWAGHAAHRGQRHCGHCAAKSRIAQRPCRRTLKPETPHAHLVDQRGPIATTATTGHALCHFGLQL